MTRQLCMTPPFKLHYSRNIALLFKLTSRFLTHLFLYLSEYYVETYNTFYSWTFEIGVSISFFKYSNILVI